MKKNTFFDEMRAAGRAYEEKKAAHKEQKKQILDTYGWGSEELKAWREEDEAIEMPYSQGAWQAYRAFEASEGILQLDDFLWDREVENFSEALKAAGISEFIYTNKSTALMDNLHDLVACGWKLIGPVAFEKEDRWGDKESIRGIQFSL